MARSIQSRHQQFFDEDAIHLVYCYRITLTNGRILHFTEHDKVIRVVLEGETTYTEFEPAGGLNMSAFESKNQFENSGGEVLGAISSSKVTESDLRQGLYDGAKVARYKVDRRFPFAGVVTKDEFVIRDLRHSDERWTANVTSKSSLLDILDGEVFERQCRHRLGDGFGDDSVAGCKVDLVSVTDHDKGIQDVDSDLPRERFQITTGQAIGYFDYGRARFVTGANAGITIEIESNEASGWINLNEPTPFDIEIGDVVDMEAGCDGRFSTCSEKFTNEDNFGGCPFLIGDRVYRRGPR